MKKTKSLVFAATIALAACLVSAPVEARQGGDFGLGFQVGDPQAAISGKMWMGEANALDMAFTFNTDHNWILLQLDYLWHFYGVIPVPAGELPLYIGAGGTAVVADNPAIGGHGVFGLAYMFGSVPIDIFLDFSPGIRVIPNMEPDIGVAFGARYFF